MPYQEENIDNSPKSTHREKFIPMKPVWQMFYSEEKSFQTPNNMYWGETMSL